MVSVSEFVFFLFLLQLKGNEQLQPKRKVKYTHRLKKKNIKEKKKNSKEIKWDLQTRKSTEREKNADKRKEKQKYEIKRIRR